MSARKLYRVSVHLDVFAFAVGESEDEACKHVLTALDGRTIPRYSLDEIGSVRRTATADVATVSHGRGDELPFGPGDDHQTVAWWLDAQAVKP